MGFGDPDHPHPLNFYRGGFGDPDHTHPLGNCFRCELPITLNADCYGCARCNHFVHMVCFELPQNMRHPLHPQHSLTLSPSPRSQITAVCNQCHNHFLGGYMYHCQACLKFSLHLKCFLTLDLKPKHEHPLNLYEIDSRITWIIPSCLTCGLLIDGIDSYAFACRGCEVYIHFDCTFLPPTVEHRHRHELTFEYNYPEESHEDYCSVCEDKDDEILDRNLSYYYCKPCDYIAHVRCVTTKRNRVTTHLEHVHEHPMIYSRELRRDNLCCVCHLTLCHDSCYFCEQCNYGLHKSCADFPRFIKHHHHNEHSLSLRSPAGLNPDGELSSCNFCCHGLGDNGLVLQCTDCDYVEHLECAVSFKHPHHVSKLLFSAYYNSFRCNACGDLGEGYRMSHRDISFPLQYDLHLECFALPGKIEHGCHLHFLYLISSPSKIKSYLSTTFACDICHTEADPDFWIYCCKQCNYIAHLKCVASDLLSAFRQSNNFVDFRSITECLKGKFIDEAKPNISTCSRYVGDHFWYADNPVFIPMGFFQEPKPPFEDHNRQPKISNVTDLEKPFNDVLQCPECEQPFSIQAYSRVYDWVHCNVKANIYPFQIETPIDHKSLALLDENVVDKLYCSICNQLIFPPTYSCAECQIFFHKSCVELPRKYIDDAGHIFVLQSPSMFNGSLSNCKYCKHPIKGYAYFCTSCEIVFDVTCALGAPLLKIENQKHSFFGKIVANTIGKCKSCDHEITNGSFFFKCGAPFCYFDLHVECALLPSSVKHRIHHHPLVLEPHLDLSVDDYICDACEEKLNPCIWVYRCSDSCGDHVTSHVSCIVTSNKKCHFIYDEECNYPHLDQIGQVNSLKQKMEVPALATSLVSATPTEQISVAF